MNISSWSIRNPVPAVLCFILLTVFGLIGFHKLQVQDFPDMDLPTISISASLEGAAPSQLENEVARKIEDKLTSLSQLDHITTKITDGAVSISVSFKLEKDPQTALSEVRNAVDGARASLPSEMAAPTVSKSDAANSALLTYTASSTTLDEQDLSWFVDNDLAKALLSVKGVSKVERIGGIDREVHVDLNPALMAGLGLTAETVSSELTAMQRERSGGQGDIGGQRQSSRTLVGVGSAADVAALTITTGDGRRVRLDQIARVTDGAADRASYAFLDGKPVVGVQITRAKGNSDVTVLHDVRKAIATFAESHPEVRLAEASNTVSPIEDNYEGSMSMLIEGALLAIAVVWWFLRDGRATLVSAAALPLSIIPTFGAIYLAGYSLNTITLLALSLVVGILVDDAIVEIENIERHLRMGKTPYQAAMEAADEIGLAVIATTFALVAVFLPTAFMSGIPGLIFRQFGVTASVAVLMSLLVARLLTPMMAAYLMKATRHAERDGPVMTRYLRWVGGGLDKRGRTMLAAGLMLLLSLAMAAALKTGFFPAQDKAQTQVTLELTPGSTLEQSRAVALQAEALIRRLPEVKGVFSTVGSASDSSNPATGTSSTADVRTSTLVVDLVARGERKSKQSAVEEAIRHQLRDLPGVRVAVNNGGNGEKLQITLAGSDATSLESAAAALESQLRTLHGIGNVTSSAALQRPEVQFRPDPARAAALGVTTEAAADAIRIGTYGAYSTSLPKLNLPERQIAIRARIDPALRQDLDAIGQLRVAGTNGSVTVASVGTLSIGSGPSQIDRLDRARNITLSVELNGRTIGEVNQEAQQLPALQHLPAGVHQVQQGELQNMSELFQSFGLAMAIGVFCVYAVLVLLFHDFLQPATILCALPLSLGGALLSLLITRMSFSMPALIGLLMLMGIVTKNSILLVEYAIMARREHGLSRLAALMDACHKRARPIVMTTIAMGAGMLPNALGLGAEPSFRQPMAIVVIGGLLASTLLSLLVIPVVFTYVDDLEQWLRRRFRQAKTHQDASLPLPVPHDQ
ncbi:efflux RND transporter permease subunit [Ralstonia pseudosolanacearum]|uniref:efflux RND transporter permease subunit n=1 Tax=Ralstonia pseudosolanacearum TaxID=1310165 RepID=UPI00048DAAA7|nr:efflux RND transporter permease subunit [Ralstonia pseudosolanacearum]MCK4139729.1 efflux RND transporter permease subunit [Ralstonia pseudosolanacearum]MDO3558045.1 efflux RND transporter permease subunit [Ralstonia pseudosolanacearum]MDO3578436.1 efflux RND transporter permease subunit [Ralstonia pseudosolanacearum]MDO3587743.1 efflux RND transporter permease subunit [Ralstonia pseudosolanacearum]UQY85584.1 efflux RND transporter permease subunit [Ralstonia pseudosolanacearum]